MKEDEELEKMKRQVALIHRLASRLPWIVVAAVLLTALFCIVLALLL